MISLNLLLVILAAISFFLAAIGISHARVNLIALGLFFWVLTILLR